MDVYLVPIAADRFETYYEAPEDDEPAESAEGLGFFGRLRVRFHAQLKEAEQARHQAAVDEPRTFLGRMQARLLRWVAERVAEQRLLWRLRTADAAMLHVAADMDPQAAETVHSVALVLSAPVAVIPGPNVLGYLFTFTVVGHFLSWRGARRGASLVRWRVVPSSDLAELRRALVPGAADRHRVIHEVADRLHLPKLARFVERMAAAGA